MAVSTFPAMVLSRAKSTFWDDCPPGRTVVAGLDVEPVVIRLKGGALRLDEGANVSFAQAEQSSPAEIATTVARSISKSPLSSKPIELLASTRQCAL